MLTTQNSLLLNGLTPDVLPYCFNFLNVFEQKIFSETCHKAEQVISELWKRIGIPFKEMKSCLLLTKQITTTFPHQFDNLVFQLPYLLSTNGLTYTAKEGGVKNVKCLFNSYTSTLFFCTRSIKEIQIVSIASLGPDESESFDHEDLYLWNISTIPSPTEPIELRINTLNQSIFFVNCLFSELIKKHPRHQECELISFKTLVKVSNNNYLFQMFEKEKIKAQFLWLEYNKEQNLKKKVKKIIKRYL